MEKDVIVTDEELVDELISMGYTEEVAIKMAKSRKHMERSLAVESSSNIVTKLNDFLNKDI